MISFNYDTSNHTQQQRNLNIVLKNLQQIVCNYLIPSSFLLRRKIMERNYLLYICQITKEIIENYHTPNQSNYKAEAVYTLQIIISTLYIKLHPTLN